MKEKIKTLDKNKEKLNLSQIAKKQKWQEQGITLIALVVTIIILLILAGVTLNIALSDNGLFSKAKKAAEEYKEAQSQEEDAIRQIATPMYSEYVGAEVTGYQPTEKTITIKGATTGLSSNIDDKGNEITGVKTNGDQTFSTEEMTWKVWDFDGNILRIIGKPTTATLTLKGAAGYNNGVYLINEICRKCYGQYENETDETMKSGISVANLRKSDIQKVSSYDYTNYVFVRGDWRKKFGETTTYEENVTYPIMWEKDKEWAYSINNEKDKEGLIWEKENEKDYGNETKNGKVNETEFKESYYSCGYKTSVENFNNEEYVGLIFEYPKEFSGDFSCWLSGRCVSLTDTIGEFGLDIIFNLASFKEYSGCAIYNSDGTSRHVTARLRPIITIDLNESGIKMDTNVDSNGKMTINLE